MRPLSLITPDATRYSAADQLSKMVGFQLPNQMEERILSVQAQLDEAQHLLDTHWLPAGDWQDPASEELFKLHLESAGEGWREAAPELLKQTGRYCAFCEVPVGPNSTAVHLLPAWRFPTKLMNFDNLIVACPVCAQVKNANFDPVLLGTNHETASTLFLNPYEFAWPSHYWNELSDGAILPFRYDLYEVKQSENETEPVRLILLDEYSAITDAWREGRISEKYGVFEWRHIVEEDQNPLITYIAARVNAAGPDVRLRHGISTVINLMQLNQVAPPSTASLVVDRRIAQRTAVFLDALATVDYLQVMSLHQPTDVVRQLGIQVAESIISTGFWGVWKTVLGHWTESDEMNQLLGSAFPGPAIHSFI